MPGVGQWRAGLDQQMDPGGLGNSPAHLRVARGVCGGLSHPKSLSARGELHPRGSSWVWCVLRTCSTHANTGHMHAGMAMGSEGKRGALQAHAADIYNAITASAKAVQSTTGCKNSLSREQESQQEK